MDHTFQDSDIQYLKRYAGSKTPEELAQRFDTDAETVNAKLRELGLAGGDAPGNPVLTDPALGTFEKGYKALYKGNYKTAVKHLEKVLEDSDQMELIARTRQLLAVCREHLDDEPDEETDPYLKAVMRKNGGDLDGAMKIVKKEDKKLDSGRFAYLAASIHALAQRPDEAEEALTRAIEHDPKHRVLAYHDPDFAILRDNDDYEHLFDVE